jgi:5-methylcytosine-specific restriction protein A
MPLPEASRIADHFSEHYGLAVSGLSGQDADGNEYLDLTPQGIHRNDGFVIRVTLGWRSLTARFTPGPYARSVVEGMASAPDHDRAVFVAIASRLLELGGRVQMQINDSDVDPQTPSNWPERWEKIVIELKKSPLAVNTEDEAETERAILDWGGKFFAAVLALMPLQERTVAEPKSPEYLPEGAKTLVEVNKYERNKFNRAACIELNGSACSVCGFRFVDAYGAIGQNYIHVHHTTPVSQMGENYLVNPLTDLVPVCPNCHAMLHRKDPPYTVEEMRALLATNT